MGLDALSMLLIVLAAFGTAVFHSIGGFAGGLLLAICLAPILGVKETVPVTAPASRPNGGTPRSGCCWK